MASTSITAPVTPLTSAHHRPPATTTVVPTSSTAQTRVNARHPQSLSGDLSNMQPPQMPAGSQQQQQQQHQQQQQQPPPPQQSQPSSQQSFSMSQPSSQPAAAPSSYRQYTDMPQKPQSDPDMGIYTVRGHTHQAFSRVFH